MTRPERIHRIARLGQAAAQAALQIRSAESLRLPLELAGAVDAFLAAADRLAKLTADEVIALESARDWGAEL